MLIRPFTLHTLLYLWSNKKQPTMQLNKPCVPLVIHPNGSVLDKCGGEAIKEGKEGGTKGETRTEIEEEIGTEIVETEMIVEVETETEIGKERGNGTGIETEIAGGMIAETVIKIEIRENIAKVNRAYDWN